MRKSRPWNSDEHPIQRLRKEVDEMFSKFVNDPNSFWNKPKSHMEETKDYFLLEVEVPGVDPKDIILEIEENIMSIKGEWKRETNLADHNNDTYVDEKSYRSLHRSFTLPYNIDVDQIKAESKNGILYIVLPKRKSGPSRKIDVL